MKNTTSLPSAVSVGAVASAATPSSGAIASLPANLPASSAPANSPGLMPPAVPMPPDFAEVDFERRFGGIARLYGTAALARFRSAHVCVIGVGGVGSWVVEALARSAIGRLTLIDLDNVAESNINRQIQALSSTIGQAKITALAERIALINPYCRVDPIEDFIDADNVATMLARGQFDYVVDAIDDVKAKSALIAWCREHAIPLITIGSAGGQIDPGKIMIRDLAKTEQEPLLAKVRKRLRREYRFPRGDKVKFGIDAVFSMEALRFPDAVACDVDPVAAAGAAKTDGVAATETNNANAADAGAAASGGVTGLNCAGFGSAMVVTASFGMMAAAQVLKNLAVAANLAENP